MVSGDLTASTPVTVNGSAGLKTQIDLLNLALSTDRLVVVPVTGRDQSWVVFKVEREA